MTTNFERFKLTAARAHERDERLTIKDMRRLAEQSGKGLRYQHDAIRAALMLGLDPAQAFDEPQIAEICATFTGRIVVGTVVDIGSLFGNGVGPNRSCIVEWGDGDDDAIGLELTTLGEDVWRRWDLDQRVAVDLDNPDIVTGVQNISLLPTDKIQHGEVQFIDDADKALVLLDGGKVEIDLRAGHGWRQGDLIAISPVDAFLPSNVSLADRAL